MQTILKFSVVKGAMQKNFHCRKAMAKRQIKVENQRRKIKGGQTQKELL